MYSPAVDICGALRIFQSRSALYRRSDDFIRLSMSWCIVASWSSNFALSNWRYVVTLEPVGIAVGLSNIVSAGGFPDSTKLKRSKYSTIHFACYKRRYLLYTRLAKVEEPTRGVTLISLWVPPKWIFHRLVIRQRSVVDLSVAPYSREQRFKQSSVRSSEISSTGLKTIGVPSL